MTKVLIHNSICDEELKQILKSTEEHLDIIAWLLKVKNENPFRIRAWLKAKVKLYSLEDRFIELVNQRALSSIDDIGSTIETEIYHFLESNLESHYLKSLLLEVPQFLVPYKLNHDIRNILAKVAHRVPCQSELELLFFCQCNYLKVHQILNKQEERQLKNYFYQMKSFPSLELQTSKIFGFYLHSPRSLKDYLDTEQTFLCQNQWLFHPDGFDSNSDQILIQNPNRPSQVKTLKQFENQYISRPQAIIDLTLCSQFFNEKLRFSDDFLACVQQHKSAFLLPLDEQLYDQVYNTIYSIQQTMDPSGFIFSLTSQDFLIYSPKMLMQLMVTCNLSEKQILNFSNAQQILRFLQRFS